MINRAGKKGRFGLQDRNSRRIERQEKAEAKLTVLIDEMSRYYTSEFGKLQAEAMILSVSENSYRN